MKKSEGAVFVWSFFLLLFSLRQMLVSAMYIITKKITFSGVILAQLIGHI